MTGEMVKWPPPVPTDEQQLSWHCLDCDAHWMYGVLEQPGDVPGCEHDDMERISDCCGKPVDPDIGFCPQCREHA